LGPNGAGKSTTIGMLTGLFPPTGGDAIICGFSVRTQMPLIQRLIGICPQFDTLWPELTTLETLLFYTRLKGLAGARAKESALASLASVELSDAKDKRVRELSGGMRRRLSIAISLVGDPKVVFLDEPTTGLDPVTRRQLWDTLKAASKNRCVVITTHSMEEAEVLCDRVGIVSGGRLACLGTPGHLKNRFGQGYMVKVNFSEEDDQRARKFVTDIFPKAVPEASFPGTATFRVDSDVLMSDNHLSSFFSKVTGPEAQQNGIKDWGLNQSSLEEVFIDIVKREEGDTGGAPV